ncbi:MAG: peptide ABC transporter substrate-binding protein [Chloroflexota bacterium]|nr:peptide ABC transporter substrate-binding protein [Chloroflexota bacterium]
MIAGTIVTTHTARRFIPITRVAIVVLAATLVPACGGPTNTVQPDASGVGTGRLVIGLIDDPDRPPPFLDISNDGGQTIYLTRFVHRGLYRYDDELSPVPDLAAEPCEIGSDLVTITCRLSDASFHDGTPVTADDVAFTYEVARRSDCEFGAGFVCVDSLAGATATSPSTVEFRLTHPDATFITLALPAIWIEPRHVIETAYETMREDAAQVDAERFATVADEINDAFAAAGAGDQSACNGPLNDLDSLMREAGVEPVPREYFAVRPDGTADPCGILDFEGQRLDGLARSLAETGPDAIATAYHALSVSWQPVGAGAWRVKGLDDARHLLLEAPGGSRPPASRVIEVREYPDEAAAVAALRSGEVDWVPNIGRDATDSLRDGSGLTFAEYGIPAFTALAYNLRPGRLFADANLREALELCIDKPATVDAATHGEATAVYSPIPPTSWAYRDDLPIPERDVEAARGLIESSGWRAGADGVYQLDGRSLTTDVFVRSDAPERVTFMDLVAEQARDCGFALKVIPADAGTVIAPLSTWPHVPGEHTEPFDATFIGWGITPDPNDVLFDSRHITAPDNPQDANFMGFADPRVDELLDAGVATYDQRERARIYREYQTILADEHPVFFAWSPVEHDAITTGIRLTDGEVNLSSQFWFWQVEKLIVTHGGE